MGARDVLLLLLATACGFLIYRLVAVTGDEAGHDDTQGRWADYERRITALEEFATTGSASLAGASVEDRLRALEARLAALEGAPVPGDAPAGTTWTEAEVASLRAALRKVQALEQREREADRFRNVVAHIAPDADPELRERTVGLLLGYMEDVRALHPPPGSPSQTPEERRAVAEKTDALREALAAQLRTLFPEETAGRLTALAPGGGPPPGATQPPATPPPR